MGYSPIEIRSSERFSRWLAQLRDEAAKDRVLARTWRLSLGNPGDAKSVGDGVWEMRIDYGPGYRVYFCYQGKSVVILLAGGDKRSQDRDIRTARQMARALEEG